MKRVHLPVSRVIGPALTVWILLCTLSTHAAQWRGLPTDGPDDSNLARTPEKITPVGGAASTDEVINLHAPKIIRMNTAKSPENRLEEAQSVSAHRRAMDWLEAHTPQDARVAIPRPQAAALLAKQGDEAATPADKMTQDKLQRELSRYDYLVEEEAHRLTPTRQKPGQFNERGLQLVYEDVPGKIRIWQVRQP